MWEERQMMCEYFRGKQLSGFFVYFPNASYGKEYHVPLVLLDQPLRECFPSHLIK